MKFTETTTAAGALPLLNDHFVAVPFDCTNVTATNGVIPAGTIVPANDGTAVGILLHLHFDERDRAVEHGLQVRGHAVDVERKAPDDDIRSPVQIQDPVLIVVDYTVSVSLLPAAETPLTGRNFSIDHVDDVGFVLSRFVQAFQEGVRHAESIALFLGTAVQYQYFHGFTRFR